MEIAGCGREEGRDLKKGNGDWRGWLSGVEKCFSGKAKFPTQCHSILFFFWIRTVSLIIRGHV